MDRFGEAGVIELVSYFEVRLAVLLTILLALPAGSAGEVAPKGGKRNTLNLRSQPGVEVFWEGVALGETDAGGLLIIDDIPSGDYRIALRKRGLRELDIQITIEERTNPSIELLLKPVRPPGGAQATSEKAAGESRVTDRETTLAEPAGETTLAEPTSEATVVEQAKKASDDLSPSPGSSDTDARPELPFSPFLGVMALLLALLAGAAGARFLPRSQKAIALSQAPPRRALDMHSEGEEIPLFEEEVDRDAPGFLEDLKQRERNIEDALDTAPRRQEETIIEVKAVEIKPAEVRPAGEA